MACVVKSRFTFIQVEERTPSPTRSKSVPPRLKVEAESSQDKYLAEVLGHAANLQPLPPPPALTPPLPVLLAEVPETQAPQGVADQRVPGSLGHPEFCCRPCVLYLRGNCQAGWGCLHCHHGEHRDVFRPTKRLREKLRRLNVPSKLLLLRHCLEVKAAGMPLGFPSIQALRNVIEDAWAVADQQAATDVSSLQTQLSALPVSALLGNQVIGSFSPELYNSIQQEFNLLKLASPAPL
ncbi:unnamed protein product [Symbiodinium sp. CCMP2592]|nr:unnamed protein product [Symbiodinium sp. CCMP2592]